MDLTISNNTLAIIDKDGMVRTTSYPELFNTSNGYIALSENAESLLVAKYGTPELVLAEAQRVCDSYEGLIRPNSFEEVCASVGLLAYMTCLV